MGACTNNKDKDVESNQKITYLINGDDEIGFSYQILRAGKLFIDQVYIPAVGNPSSNEVKINWKEKDKSKPYQAILLDKSLTKIYEAIHDEDEFTISVSNLENGTYYLILNQGEIRFSEPILVNH